MSEFKYACPVCGQHIKCDSSQGGSVMECPTCFQKITVPQAPATDDQKLIITGTKVGERPIQKTPEGSPAPAAKGFPLGAVILLALIVAGAAALFAFRGEIFHRSPVPEQTDEASATPTPVKAARPDAPVASDTNWMLNLDAMTNFPDAPVAGRIHGADFICERAILQNGTLTLRAGRSGPLDFGVQINFGGAQPEALAGQSLNVATNAPMAARITLHWQDGGQDAKLNLQGGYALRLNFDQAAGSRLAGKIYLCAPDEMKSYLMGTFNAEIRKSKPKPAPAKK